MLNHDNLPDIYNLWKSPFSESFSDLLGTSTCLSPKEKKELIALEQLYVSEEALARKNSDELYHTHGVLSAEVVMFTLLNNEHVEGLDCFSLISAALLHDFNGFVSKDKKFAEAMDLLESKGLVDLLGLDMLNSIEKLLQYSSYDLTKPINWGSSLLDGDINEVTVPEDIPLEGLLVAYGDIIGQLCSVDYKERAKELLKVLEIDDPDFIPLKLLVLADEIIKSLRARASVNVPASILNSVLDNTQKARLRYEYTFSFE